jgi:amylosucrase
VQEQIFSGLSKLEKIRKKRRVFDSSTVVYTYDVKNPSILAILRENEEERFIGLFNFDNKDMTAWMDEQGEFTNLLTGEKIVMKDVVLPAYDFLWVSIDKNGV